MSIVTWIAGFIGAGAFGAIFSKIHSAQKRKEEQYKKDVQTLSDTLKKQSEFYAKKETIKNESNAEHKKMDSSGDALQSALDKLSNRPAGD